MAVLQMLSEVIRPEELLLVIAFAKLVSRNNMRRASIFIGRVRKFLAAVAAVIVSRRLPAPLPTVKGILRILKRRTGP